MHAPGFALLVSVASSGYCACGHCVRPRSCAPTCHRTQADANAAAAEIDNVSARFEELDAEIDRLEGVIVATRQRADELQIIVRQRALRAYTERDTSDLDVMLAADDPLDAARRTALLDHANQTDRQAVKQLGILRDELHSQQRDVEQQREDQRKVKEQLDAKYATVQSLLAEASEARDALVSEAREGEG